MKKIFTLFVFAFELGYLYGQIYVPFPSSNAEWSEIYYHYASNCDSPYCKYQYVQQGDTTIDSKYYHKIYYNDSNSSYYFGGIREENKKIFARHYLVNFELKIYDFSLNIGDSVKSYCILMDSTYYFWNQITAIDSLLMPDLTYRKRFHLLLNNPTLSWIEGIGTAEGLFSFIDCTTCGDCWNELVCFKKNDIIDYLNETHELCFDIYNQTNELKNNLNLLKVFPNPVNNRSFIDFESENELINQIEFYDILGTKTKTVHDIFSKNAHIPIDNTSEGIYIIKVQLMNNMNIFKKLTIK